MRWSCRAELLRGERRPGEVLVTVDGHPLDWAGVVGGAEITHRGARREATAAQGLAQLAVAPCCADPPTDEETAEQVYQRLMWGVLAPVEAARRRRAQGAVET